MYSTLTIHHTNELENLMTTRNAMDYLVPVDDMINDLQKEIDNVLWDNYGESTEHLQKQLDYYLNLKDEGVIYEPTF